MIFAYFGPETTIPLMSVLAGVVGFFLTVGRLITYKIVPRSIRAKFARKKKFPARKSVEPLAEASTDL